MPAQTEQMAPPEGWRATVAAVKNTDDLQNLYEKEARKWFTSDVQQAFTAKKNELQGA